MNHFLDAQCTLYPDEAVGLPVKRFYLPDSSLSVCVYDGVLTGAEIRDGLKAHVQDPIYHPQMTEIADLTSVMRFDLDFAQADAVVRSLNELYSVEKKIHILTSSELAYGIGRMFQNLMATHGGSTALIHKSETETLEALALPYRTMKDLLERCTLRTVPA